VVIEQLKAAKQKLDDFLQSQGLEARPEAVPNLMGDDARVAFIKQFKEVQRLTTQLDQYTDLTDEQRREIEQTLPKDDARAFRGVYLETAKRLKAKQGKTGGDTPGIDDQVSETPDKFGSDTPEEAIDQLDFEFVLFASADIDYDYIMNLIARFSGQTPSQQEMSREQLIRLIRSDAKFMDELDEITAYVRTLETGKPLTEEEVRNGYQRFKDERHAAELAAVAAKNGLTNEALQTFVDAILDRMIFDGEQLTDLMEPLDLGWRERREKELALMDDLVPLLKKRAAGRTISGLNAYEQ
jgi:type I restriction enzyme R subunit